MAKVGKSKTTLLSLPFPFLHNRYIRKHTLKVRNSLSPCPFLHLQIFKFNIKLKHPSSSSEQLYFLTYLAKFTLPKSLVIMTPGFSVLYTYSRDIFSSNDHQFLPIEKKKISQRLPITKKIKFEYLYIIQIHPKIPLSPQYYNLSYLHHFSKQFS